MSDERQYLWRKASQNKFSDQWWRQHDRILAIGKQLEQLWHIHRLELAGSPRHYPVIRAEKDLFSDYTDPQRLGVARIDEGDLDGFVIEKPTIRPDLPEKEFFPLVYHHSVLISLSTQILREVLVELKAADRRRRRHNMTLHELRVHQRQRVLP